MKKTSFILLTLAALLVCGCEKDPADNPGGNSSESTIDVTPYLGTYLMTRHTDLILTVATFNIPINRDLDVETITVKKDPAQEYGVIMTSSDGMYLRGTVDTTGLHLQNDTIRFSIDTLGANAIDGHTVAPRHFSPCQRSDGLDQHRLRHCLGHRAHPWPAHRNHHGQYALPHRPPLTAPDSINKKEESRLKSLLSLFRVGGGARTHDLQIHNLAL